LDILPEFPSFSFQNSLQCSFFFPLPFFSGIVVRASSPGLWVSPSVSIGNDGSSLLPSCSRSCLRIFHFLLESSFFVDSSFECQSASSFWFFLLFLFSPRGGVVMIRKVPPPTTKLLQVLGGICYLVFFFGCLVFLMTPLLFFFLFTSRSSATLSEARVWHDRPALPSG